jgi:hypothetical protein
MQESAQAYTHGMYLVTIPMRATLELEAMDEEAGYNRTW